MLTAEEAASVLDSSSAEPADQRLAKLLMGKGLITQEEYENTLSTVRAESPVSPGGAKLVPAVMRTRPASVREAPAGVFPAQKPAEQKFVPAIAPMRVLPITTPKKDGLLPDIKLGSGVSLRPYGFFKASVVNQTASSGGPTFGSNDFPQGPLLLGDTGPTADGQFHIKDRAFRMGVDFEWPDVSPNITLTGKLEFDFEGNFTNVNNRNISANRSSQPSLRLAWVRMDTKIADKPVFFQFGQDWSIFGSSTLMDIFETTGFGFAQGNLYERMPMFRTGVQFGKGDLKVQPEFAVALPGFGEPGLDADQRTRFGSRVGPESDRPEYQTRLVFQYPLSRARGVVPAQFILSYDNAERAESVQASNIPAGALRTAFPDGVRLTSQRNAWSAEMQLPTSWFTLVGKYYRGGDLRYYFMGQFNDVFTDLGTASSIGTATSFAGRTISFGCSGGVGPACTGGTIVHSNLEPVMGQGGFLQLGLPLSRLFNADPEGRAGFGGWSLYLTYGLDSAFAKDARRANGLLRTDHGSVQLRYKFNKWVTFVHEETYLDTRTADGILK
ncbi:MAG: hypothetical protein JSS69_02455, partial [Acidobacteria bacterium]|nr:hypothetical protein [Acidobacteriota bacterium]